MNITVVGAGAVGGYFGARLQEAGAHVTFLVRERRYHELKKHGLHITSVNGDYTLVDIETVMDSNDISSCDLVLVAVKGYHLEEVISNIQSLVNRGAKVLPLLNGVEHYEKLQEQFGKESVLGGLCFIITTLDENGHIIHTSQQHDMVFGTLHESQVKICNDLDKLTKKANVNALYSNDILKDIWRKYAFITAYSGLTTASRLPIGPVREEKASVELLQSVLQEMKLLSSAYEVDLGENFVEETVGKMYQLPADSTSSMHQDFRKGLQLEVEGLQGGAVRLAQAVELKLSVVETLYALIKPHEFPKKQKNY
ncbi:ketopantoate reductase family protein [Bacillus taeanensis]|uniref:2-dehydropantoate 2-reductase n=1 Tax=Bacillus taeanensis TaxID=273032 RepID=A0A366XYR2_9BACI|nr:ketopantoate reductase family protein [Bacillus taeanensis]RBW69304.1 ketopantoate reductase family protein [Bacillus taeanensis]